VQQGKSLLTALSQEANLFVKRGKEGAPELLHQPGFGNSQSGTLLERKIKPAPRQKVRGEMAVVNYQEVDMVTLTKVLDHLRIARIVSNEKFLQPRLKLLPVTFRPDVRQFISGESPASGKGRHGIHQMGLAGDEGILGSLGQGFT